MSRFIRVLQWAVLIIFGALLAYDFLFVGLNIFQNKYVIVSTLLVLMLELALWVIYKLTEDD
ncbi:hypothetical protein [Vibrio palustris]|uniref:Uncharacterized protein n=1 Tax=Vibrio palustris TaxID=1918946 RepID=A0A1R4B2N5_9VIBR|nr:hypothetical protein [Vibrio palustris]SJL83163.1 hypothetical protein VPAL9027_01112 [Vibrio palustris]